MGQEIERKYLVTGDDWRQDATGGVPIRQGYLAVTETCSVRVRVKGKAGFITVKGARSGQTRPEFEYPIPAADADRMIEELCGDAVVEKTRYELPLGHLVLEVDEFHGRNRGLVVAELELPSDTDRIPPLPSWIGEDVTADDRYYSAHLSRHPYATKRCDPLGP